MGHSTFAPRRASNAQGKRVILQFVTRHTRSRLVLEQSQPATEGSPRAFEDFYAQEYAAVVGLAYALSGSRSGAEDLAQEAFFAAHRNWDRIGGYDQPGAWVRRVVANMSVSAFRRRAAEARALGRAALGEHTVLPDLGAGDPDFWNAVRALPRRQAQVIALFYLEDRPIAEIAEILDMTPGTVKRHLYDGRRGLAQRLREEANR
jgi:RNA polymerase sigma-70 factor (ECF subfamily)